METKAEFLKSKLVPKTVRNVRAGTGKDDAARGMYRPEVKLDLQRSRLLTESYKKTDGEPMVIRRAKALANILTKMDLYIQDWERIVGNHAATPQGIYYGIDQMWRIEMPDAASAFGFRAALMRIKRAIAGEFCEFLTSG